MSITELAWFKSSYSGSDGDSCVEVALRPHIVHVRDSKDADGPQVVVSAAGWAEFVAYVGRG